VTVDGAELSLGMVGFRRVDADRSDGAFTLLLNGERVFCRGACWVPIDVVSLAAPPADVRAMVELVRDAGMNMLRLMGTMVYEDAAFWDACDELGILVWQDVMFAAMDPPDDERFIAELTGEVREVLAALQGRPSLAVVCGSTEAEQQAAMLGLPRDRWRMPLFEDVLPAIVDQVAPGVPYVPSSPSGGDLPFQVDAGVSHYFGVGAYLRPLDDVRRSRVRFTSECLAFAIPPERQTVDDTFRTATYAGHHPTWKRRIPRDAGTSWDFEDVREHYVEQLFSVPGLETRYSDPERMLDLGRAAIAHLMASAMAEWRRESSPCAGALVAASRDLWPGAGWGVVDALGRPKAPWYALRRVQQAQTVFAIDEGLNGLRFHVVNDAARPLVGRIRIERFGHGEARLEYVEVDVTVPARSSVELHGDDQLGGFRDLTYAFRFGPPEHDIVVATLLIGETRIARAVHLPLGLARPLEPDVGLRASARPLEDGDWLLVVETRRFAQSVVVDAPGFRPDDSWFDLPPAVRLVPCPGRRLGPRRRRALPLLRRRVLGSPHRVSRPGPTAGRRRLRGGQARL
jgi:beta-mannosidase